MTEDLRQSYELTFRRCWEARFFSHLDLMRGLMRMLRRTGLQVYFTEGFNPKPRVSYLTKPLSVGHTSECERFGFMLVEQGDIGEIETALKKHIPSPLGFESVGLLPSGRQKDESELEYYIFIRRGHERMIEEALNRDVPGGVKELTREQIESARVLYDHTDSAAMLDEYYNGGFVFNIDTGSGYRRPDRILFPEAEIGPEVLFFHRKRELFNSSK